LLIRAVKSCPIRLAMPRRFRSVSIFPSVDMLIVYLGSQPGTMCLRRPSRLRKFPLSQPAATVAVAVGVAMGVGVDVAPVAVAVAVAVAVLVAVAVAVLVAVAVAVLVAVAVAASGASPTAPDTHAAFPCVRFCAGDVLVEAAVSR